jgi:glycosyltransferase involved in cell wall biosynthesis
MISAKGHEHLVSALRQIRSVRPDAVLVIVGDGPLAPRLRDQVRASGLEGTVFLPGALRASSELYAALDVFVYPSIVGVFGLVVLEAMACGVPVVASDLPGSTTLLTDGFNVLVVPPADPAAIARAVLRLVGDPELAEMLTSQAEERVRLRFSREAMVDRYLAIYRAVLARRRTTRVSRARSGSG